MTTARSTWKQAEARAAAFFGARRQICSGSSGRADTTCSDSTHPQLYIEHKLRAKCTARTLWREASAKATREKKTPVVCLAEKHCPGFLLVVHSDHFESVVEEWLAARGEARVPKQGA